VKESEVTKQKAEQPKTDTVAACEQTLRELEAKRAALVARGAELDQPRPLSGKADSGADIAE
jgi:hypothetical protein